jgi:hypothetical protein
MLGDWQAIRPVIAGAGCGWSYNGGERNRCGTERGLGGQCWGGAAYGQWAASRPLAAQSPWEVPAAHTTDILYGGSVTGASGQEQSVVGLRLPFFVGQAGGSGVEGLEA